MSNVNVQYTLTLQDLASPQFRIAERNAQSLENSISKLNSTLGNTAAAFGVGWGLHQLVNFTKDAVQGYADMETAMMRIKNVSPSAEEGFKNQKFILEEISKYKIPLQETTDSYGKFLTMIANSGLAAEQVRKLHDEVLAISKVTGAPSSKMDIAVRDIGIMLGEGVLEARHLRGLSYVMPQLIPFVAKAMGIDEELLKHKGTAEGEEKATQVLSKLISSGKLTKSAISSNVLLEAMQQLYTTMKDKIPEAVNTTGSAIIDLDNAWLEAKNTIVDQFRPELFELIKSLKEGANWIKEHKEQIKEWAIVIKDLIEIWVKYKVIVEVINLANLSYLRFMEGYAVAAAPQITAINSTTAAYQALNAQLITLIDLQAAAGVGSGSLTIPQAQYFTNAARAGAGVASVETAAATGIAAASTTASITAIISTALPIGLGMVLASYGINKLGEWSSNAARKEFSNQWEMVDDPNSPLGWHWKERNKAEQQKLSGVANQAGTLGILSAGTTSLNVGDYSQFGKFLGADAQGKVKTKTPHISLYPEHDKVTGQRVITYNITIKEMGNIGKIEVNDKKDFDYKEFKTHMSEVLLDVVNDAQIRAGN